MYKQLIVGLDPGATVGYAVLDIDGNLISIKSSKQLPLSTLISEITSFGKVVAVGCDKKVVPSLVKKFGVKVGARIIRPDADLLIDYKRELAKNFEFKDYHQRDSLASAVFAYQRLKSLLTKVNSFVATYNKNELRDKIILLVMKGMPIKLACAALETPEEEIIEAKAYPGDNHSKRQIKSKELLQVFEKLDSLEKENALLKEHNCTLVNRINNLNISNQELKTRLGSITSDKKAEQLINLKEQRLVRLYSQLNEKDKLIKNLCNEISNLNDLLLNVNNIILLKRLDNLGQKEFYAKNKKLQISKGDMLFVNNSNIYSKEVVDFLKDKVEIILTSSVSNKTKNSLGFVFLDAKRFSITEMGGIAIVNKKEFEENKFKSDMLAQIISSYKEERINFLNQSN